MRHIFGALARRWPRAGQCRSRSKKAGIKPALIVRQFGISQSDVRKVLASERFRSCMQTRRKYSLTTHLPEGHHRLRPHQGIHRRPSQKQKPGCDHDSEAPMPRCSPIPGNHDARAGRTRPAARHAAQAARRPLPPCRSTGRPSNRAHGGRRGARKEAEQAGLTVAREAAN